MTRILLIISFFLFVTPNGYSQKKQSKKWHRRGKGIVRFQRQYIYIKDLKNIQVLDTILPVYNASKDSIVISFADPSYIKSTTEPAIIPPKTEAKIRIVLDPKTVKNKKGELIWGKTYNRVTMTIRKSNNPSILQRKYYILRTFISEDFSQLTKKERKRAPVIKFDTITYNFGTVKKNSKIVYDFVFTNLGKNDLLIRYAHAC